MTEDRALLDRIAVDPDVMVGKLVLGFLAAKPDLGELLAAYPHLTVDDVKACLAYARAVVHRQRRRGPRAIDDVAHAASA